VGWRERDWAKWTNEERRRFYGSGRGSGLDTSTGGGASLPPVRSSRGRSRSGGSSGSLLGVLLFLAAVAFALHSMGISLPGHSHRQPSPVLAAPLPTSVLPTPRVVVPRKHSTPGVSAVRYVRMNGPSSVPHGSYMTTSGTLAPGVSGPVLVEARWSSGRWYKLASTTAQGGAYRIRYLLAQPGVVHVRIALPDGNYAVATIRVT
jgi:hypothetical protein